MKIRILCAGLLGVLPLITVADQICGCPNCGSCDLKSVCRVVPSIKKETKTVYGCAEEEICLPGRSCHCGKEDVPDCESRKGYSTITRWFPTCGRIICKKTLTKRTVTEEKEICTCKVMKSCCHCGYEFDPKSKPTGTGSAP